MSLELTEILYDATRATCGLVIETNDAERLRQKFYAIRRDVPELQQLAFIISPFNGVDLWVVKKGDSSAEE